MMEWVRAKLTGWWSRLKQSPLALLWIAAVATFIGAVASFYDPTTGFSDLIVIGDRAPAYVTQLQEVPHYVYKESWGYDGAYYVQLALNPTLDNPELAKAIDNLPYRARRILFCWVAWALGLGQPYLIVQMHALINVFSWLILAAVLLRWFPPTSWSNFLRWGGIMFSHGACMSVRHSLVDLPSLLLVALAMRSLERGDRGRGMVTLALAGLGKETSVLSVLGAADFDWRSLRSWGRLAGVGVLITLPLLLWLGYVQWKVGPAGDPGLGNFTWPLAGLAEKWGDAVARVNVQPDSNLHWATLGVVAALTVQWFFLLLRWRPADPWWRLGAAFALMMTFLSTPVWEGFPGAATRVLLPMMLAFNLLVPRGRRWLPLLLAGNLTVFAGYGEYSPPTGPFYRISGASRLAAAVRVEPTKGWYETQSSFFEIWRWGEPHSEIEVSGATGTDLTLVVRGRASALDVRTLRIAVNGAPAWSGEISRDRRDFEFRCALPREGVTLSFEADTPGAHTSEEAKARRQAFKIVNLEFEAQPKAAL